MGLEHLKGSGTLEEHPDTVLLLEWDNDTKDFIIRIEKQRHGECGKVGVCYEPEYFAFSDITGSKRVLPSKGLFDSGDGASSPPFGYKD
jgi:predicted ATP-dependent serine protease